MSKSVLYSANTASQTTTAAGTVINFGTVVRRYGCNAELSGGNAVVKGSGYYGVDISITFTASGAGTAVIQLLKDGTAVTGATASITTAESTTYTVYIPSVVRNVCCCESAISVVISGVAGAVTNAAIVVQKL